MADLSWRNEQIDMVDSMTDVVDEETLLKCFRDPESTATDEERALRLLSRHPHPKRVRKVRNHEVAYYRPHYQFSMLHYACLNGWHDVSRELVDKYQCDPHLENRRGNTPLHCACQGGNIDIVRFLIIDHHCDPACRERLGRTPLHYACWSGKLDIVKYLVEECHCDPRVKEGFAGVTPLQYACYRGKVDIIKFLIVDHHCDPACRGEWGRTPLHWACQSGDLGFVKYLVEECHCNPGVKDKNGVTPLHVAAQKEPNVLMFLLSHFPPLKVVRSVINSDWLPPPKIALLLLQTFVKCRMEYPLESVFKIFVLGNHAAGKSTLVKVIENEITSFFGSFAGQLRKISESAVVPLTAGIIPVNIDSRTLDQIVIYDMAGHYQYYSSHAALLRNLASSSAGMFLVVVSLNQEKEEIIRQLRYWNSFVDNCCSSADRPLTVAVFSHADEVTEDKPERKSSDIVKELAHSEASSSFSEIVTLDCRKLASGGLTKISKIVAGCCAKFRQTIRFDLEVQLLYNFISSRLADRTACTVSELQSLIKQEQGEDSFVIEIRSREFLPTNVRIDQCVAMTGRKVYLPTSAITLSLHLTTLSDKGQFLFLRNAQKVEDSWLVIDKAVLLYEVNGTIFAPNNFKQHHKIANSTGVVPFSKIREVFPKRDPDMVVAFLQHLEFCQEISEAEVSLISRQHFRCSSGPEERFFFFPALVSEERPSGAGEAIDTPSYRCGWTLQCSRPHQFLTPQFLHVLLLRLAFSFALAHDNTCEVQASPVLERRCSVWKNGICWLSRKGVESTVEVIEQNTAVFLTISCFEDSEMECVEHRSQLIKCILEAKEELCPAVTMKLESLMHPNCLTTPVSGNSLQLFSLFELVQALLENESGLVSQPGLKMIKINQLLYFEPYSCFSAETLRELNTESDKLIPKAFPEEVSKNSHTKLDQLKQVLSIDSAKFQAALARAPPFQRDQPKYQCKLVFQVWKENTQSPTYRALRSALDKYSVFCGRNPLELAGVGGAQVPPDQPGLATVSLDELTLQPDFSYDDSELSDYDTGSDQELMPLISSCSDPSTYLTPPQKTDDSELSDEDTGGDSSAQSTLPQRTDQPKLFQLQKFKGQGGRTVKVIEQVAPVWEQLACSLHFQPAVIRTIDRKNHYQCDLACMDMFGRWLEGSARQPVSWETLMAALRDSGERDLQKLATVLDAALL